MSPTPSSPGRRPTGLRAIAAVTALACLGLCAGAWAQAPAAAPPPPDLSQMKAEPAPASRGRAAPAPAAKRTGAGDGQGGTSSTTTQDGPGEPVIQRNVIEDEGSRIEETRVRGQLQRVIVTPKVGAPVRYEIMPGDGSGSEASRSTAGKRVWNVLQF
jgi:hypothetical protein